MIGKTYTISEIAQALQIDPKIDGSLELSDINQIATDSRYKNIGPGTLFFALKTNRNNGHAYINDAYNSGVRMFICDESEGYDQKADAVYLMVDSCIDALQKLAKYHRNQLKYPILAITGSNGKTVVKEWFYQLASNFVHIVRSPKSYNSQIGVPLSILSFPENASIGVVEAGISEPGEMNRLKQLIEPDIGLLTNVHFAHIENFENRTELINEKLKLFEGCPLIYESNKENEYGRFRREWTDKDINWSFDSDAPMRAKVEKEVQENQSLIRIHFKGVSYDFAIPYTDEASVQNAIHCAMICLYFELPMPELEDGFSRLSPVAMRLEQIKGINDCTIINDSYNSDITSLEIALRFMNMQNQHANKTLILSDIAQTGLKPEELYQKVNELCKANNLNRLIGIGEEMNSGKHQFEMDFQSYENTDEFFQAQDNITFRNEVILVKGSRVYEFERIVSSLTLRTHETRLEVNLTALINNLNFYRSLLQPETKMMIMVKAFSYGTGSYEIVNILQHQGADYLAVAYVDEGVHLREHGCDLPIMVMNPALDELETMVKYNLEPEVFSLSNLKLVDHYSEAHKCNINVHLKLETGMHRLGFEQEDLDQVVQILKNNPRMKVVSTFSHLVASDDPAKDGFTYQQHEHFRHSIEKIQSGLDQQFVCHLLNSDGIFRFPDLQEDMVRLGIGLYGISSVDNLKKHIQPVIKLLTSISQIKRVEKGETVGYTGKFTAERNMRTATIPVGYADGISRAMGNGQWKVRIGGKLAPIIGNVCMDMCMIDITDLSGVKEKDEVQVIGPGNDVYEMAEIDQTIPYEILTSFSERIKRVFHYGE